MIAGLHDLTEDENLNPVFKLLLASSTRSKFVKRIMPSECYIWVGSENGCRNGPTPREVNLASRRSRREQYERWVEEDYTSINEEDVVGFMTSSENSDRSME